MNYTHLWILNTIYLKKTKTKTNKKILISQNKIIFEEIHRQLYELLQI